MPRFVRLASILLAAALVLPSLGHAANWYAGAEGGVNVSELTGDGVDGSDTKNGFIGGGFVGNQFSRFLGFRFEALMVEKGAKGPLTVTGDAHTHTGEWILTYFDFPLLLTGHIPLGTRWAINAFAGPTFGVNVKSQLNVQGHELEAIRDRTEKFELGSAFGGGLELKLTACSIFAEGRYSLGLQNIVKDVPNVDVKNRGVAVMGGLKFPVD
jgi:hypothetical protein